MKKIFAMIMIVVAAMVFIAGCDKKTETEPTAPATVTAPAEKTATSDMAMADTAVVEQTICPVMGGPINKELFVEYQGKKVYLCCEDCVKMFKANPEKYLAKLPQFKDVVDKAVTNVADMPAMPEMPGMKMAEQTKCPVMGGPIDKQYYVEYKGKKVYFCCGGCDTTFLADPEKYLAKLPQFGGKEE